MTLLMALRVFAADCMSLPSPISSRMGFTIPSLRNFAIVLKYVANWSLLSSMVSNGVSFSSLFPPSIRGIRPSETPSMTFGMYVMTLFMAFSIFAAVCMSFASPISSRIGSTMPSLRNFAIDLK